MKMRNALVVIAAIATFSMPSKADTLKLMGAGSLRAAMTDMLQQFPAQSDTVEAPQFGASGLLREKIERGATVDVFTSADVEQARRLAAGHPERIVVQFARNTLCALARPEVGLNQTNFLDRLLDPAVQIATSTPGSDPLGTYSWAVLDRADSIKPGASAVLKAKTKKLVGGGEKTPPLVPGKGVIEGVFLSNATDVMFIYCSAVPALQREFPSLTSVKLPANITVEPVNGMVIVNPKPVAWRFAAFVMSERGQKILRDHGFDPVALPEPLSP